MDDIKRTVAVLQQKKYLAQALVILEHDLPMIFIRHYPIAQARRSHLKNVTANKHGDINFVGGGFSRVWIEN